MKKNISYLATAVLMSLSLAACGGGGGGGGSSTPTTPTGGGGDGGGNGGGNTGSTDPLSFTAINTSSSVEENARAVFEFSVSGAQGNVSADYTLTSLDAPVDVNVDESSTSVTVELTVDEMVKANEEATLTVEVTDDAGRSKEWSGTVSFVNTSGELLISKIESMSQSAQNYAGLSEEIELTKRLEETAILLNSDYAPEGAPLYKKVSALSSEETANYLVYWAEDYTALVESYRSGDAKESQFDNAESSLADVAEDHLAGVIETMQKAVESTAGLVTPPSLGKVFVSNNGKLSQFVGNPDLGEYTDAGQWVFNADYQYLEAIAFPNSQQCAAE